jgi:hypothetical protein
MEHRSEQHDGRSAKNQTYSCHLNQSPGYHDSLSPVPALRMGIQHRSCHRSSTAAARKNLDLWAGLESARFMACAGRMRTFAKRELDAKQEGLRTFAKTRRPSPRINQYAAETGLLRAVERSASSYRRLIIEQPALDSRPVAGWTRAVRRVILRAEAGRVAPAGSGA